MTKSFLFTFAVALFMTVLPSIAVEIDGPHTTTTPIALTLTDWAESPDNTSLAFQKFNVAGATLTNVKLELSGLMNTDISITNIGSSASSGNVSTRLRVSVTHPDFSLGEPQIDKLSPPLEFTDLAVGDTATGSFDDIELYAVKNYTASTILAAFTGIGNIVLDADTYTTTSLEASGSFNSQQITYASLTGSVTYTYDPIPEPATITLLTIGALTLLKRKNSK